MNRIDIRAIEALAVTIGYSDLIMRPLDMARFGYLFLKDGKWNNRQILSPE